MIRILIVHPTRLVSSLYASVFDDRPNIEVVGQATTVKDALDQIETTPCNIILASAMLADNGALDLTREISENYPEIKVLVVGLPKSKSAILQYVMAGASGYVLQDVTIDVLIKNVKAIQEDKALVSPSMAAAFMEHIAELAHISAGPYLKPRAYDELTPRELEVLELISEGLTNQEIADRLYIEVGTVKNHVHNILKKLDVASREDAAAHLPFIKQEGPD
ncbi:MAG: response regulator transcription factor [Chloroflexota bacterium]|jgi:DNA-binding NarL/FixJ family response regulator